MSLLCMHSSVLKDYEEQHSVTTLLIEPVSVSDAHTAHSVLMLCKPPFSFASRLLVHPGQEGALEGD